MAECEREPELGGYDCHFVEEVPEALTCPVCLGAFKDPHLISCCGTKLCANCIERIYHAGQPCPHCRATNYTSLLDRALQRDVLNLRVFCDNKDAGCPWVNELRHMEGHLRRECLHVVVQCRYCRRDLLRQDMRAHEEEECENRPLEIKLLHRINVLERENVEQRGMIARLTQLVQEQETARNELEQSTVKEITDADTRLADQIDFVNKKVTSMEDDLKKSIQSVGKETTARHKEMDKINRTIDTLNKADLPRKMADLEEQFKNLADRLRGFSETEKALVRAQEVLSKATQGMKVPAWQRPLPLAMFSTVPPCQFLLMRFSNIRTSGKPWYSPPFFSEPGGHKFCLRIDANGMLEGKQTHLSVWVYVMKGKHDEALQWPFMGKVTVQLLNWVEDRGHIQNIVSFDDAAGDKVRSRVTSGECAATGRGSSKFLSHATLPYNKEKNTQFLRDDSLCFKILKVESV